MLGAEYRVPVNENSAIDIDCDIDFEGMIQDRLLSVNLGIQYLIQQPQGRDAPGKYLVKKQFRSLCKETISNLTVISGRE